MPMCGLQCTGKSENKGVSLSGVAASPQASHHLMEVYHQIVHLFYIFCLVKKIPKCLFPFLFFSRAMRVPERLPPHRVNNLRAADAKDYFHQYISVQKSLIILSLLPEFS